MGIPVKTNLALAALFVSLAVLAYVVLPLVLVPRDPRWLLLLVPWVLSANTNWSLIHEAIHGHLFHSANAVGGRVLGICFGGPLLTLRAGHLMHHRFNGSPVDRPEVYRHRPHFVRYYFSMLLGLHLSHVVGAVAILLPRPAAQWILRRFVPGDGSDADAYRAAFIDHVWSRGTWIARFDALLAIGLLVFAFIAYGTFWPFLLGAWIGRAFLISFMDNSYHYGLPLHDFYGARNARSMGSAFLLHFNIHGVHHRHPDAAWSDLPAMFNGSYDANLIPMALRQLRGPIPAARLENSSSTPGPSSAAAAQTAPPSGSPSSG